MNAHHILPLVLLFAACNPPANLTADITTGECEGTPGAKERATTDSATDSGEPDIWGEVSGTDILVHLDNMTANCCPTPGASFTTSGTEITVDFQSESDETMSCDCICVMDFMVTIGGATTGEWTIYVNYNGTEEQAALGVTIP